MNRRHLTQEGSVLSSTVEPRHTEHVYNDRLDTVKEVRLQSLIKSM